MQMKKSGMYIVIGILMILFCSMTGKPDKIISDDLKYTFIETIPRKGIVIKTDTILLDSMKINDVIQLFDTSNIHTKLVINKVIHLDIFSLNSLPPKSDQVNELPEYDPVNKLPEHNPVNERKRTNNRKYTGYSV